MKSIKDKIGPAEISVLATVGNDDEHADVSIALITLDAAGIRALSALEVSFASFIPAPRLAEWDLPDGIRVEWLTDIPEPFSVWDEDDELGSKYTILTAEQTKLVREMVESRGLDELVWRVESDSLKLNDGGFIAVASYKNARGGVEAELPPSLDLAHALGVHLGLNALAEGEPLIHLQDDEDMGQAECGCLLTAESGGSGARFTPCSPHRVALDPLKLAHSIFRFASHDEIEIRREKYGLRILVNQKPLLIVDLFHLSSDSEGIEGSKGLRGVPQAIISSAIPNLHDCARIRWFNTGVALMSDHPDALSWRNDGPGESRHFIQIGGGGDDER